MQPKMKSSCHPLTPTVVLVPVDRQGKPMQDLVVRSKQQELDRAIRKKDWRMPYHR